MAVQYQATARREDRDRPSSLQARSLDQGRQRYDQRMSRSSYRNDKCLSNRRPQVNIEALCSVSYSGTQTPSRLLFLGGSHRRRTNEAILQLQRSFHLDCIQNRAERASTAGVDRGNRCRTNVAALRSGSVGSKHGVSGRGDAAGTSEGKTCVLGSLRTASGGGDTKKSIRRLSRSSHGGRCATATARSASSQMEASCRLSRNKPSIGTDAYYLEKMKEVLYEFKSAATRSSPTKIQDYLYLGSYLDANNPAYLCRLGIDHVLNCAATQRNAGLCPYGADTGIAWYMGIPAEDKQSHNMLQYVDDTNAFISEARQRGGKILVHCVMGVNRSGFVVAAYLIGVLKMTLLSAVKLLKERRCTVLYNTGFQRQLVWYARKKGLL